MKTNRKPTNSWLMILMILIVVLMTGCSNSSTNTVKNTSDISTEMPIRTTTTTITRAPTNTPKPSQTATSTSSSASITQTAVPTIKTITELTASYAPEATSLPTSNAEPNEGMFDPWFEAYTGVAYSSGMDSEWAYGNQRKEFTSSRPCYVRISNSIVAPWHWGYVYGLGKQITITYRFTGTANCQVDVSDGFLTKIETNDPNVIEYTRVIEAKASKVDNNVVVFQYTPSSAGSISLEIVYDSQVNSKYDVRSTIYFVDSEW